MNTIDRINTANNTNDVSEITERYLRSIGEHDNATGESYRETADRLGGDEVLDAADARWMELEK